jgi:acid phosphatase family membrane protein YuiD
MIPELSPYIIAIVLGWVVAQGIKYILIAYKEKTFRSLRHLYLSGNMPSAHSATVVALLTVVGLRDGVGSGLFGVAALFAAIVMYDAVMVRRSSGDQGRALRELIKEQKSDVRLPRVAKGHEPREVLVGALIGLALGAVVFLATK